MRFLSELNTHLILEGAKIEGNFSEGYYYNEEQYYYSEAEELLNFCKWIDENTGDASRYNIQMLWKAFKNPNDKKLQSQVEKLKLKIKEIKSY